MAKKKKKKVRISFRKNRQVRTRQRGLTQEFVEHGFEDDESVRQERVSGKGELVRKRTIFVEEVDETDATDAGTKVSPGGDASTCLEGRVLEVFGLISIVEAQDGKTYPCSVRRILRTLSTDLRHVVAAGDRVLFRTEGEEGVIERVEPRRGVLSRTSRGRQHVLVANVDQILIVASAAEPELKPHLIDRFLVTAEKAGIRPLICINKIDLIDPVPLQPIVGVFCRMGYEVLQVSATTGLNIERLKSRLAGNETVVAGQSGVGKSSLLNAMQPGLNLRTREVSAGTDKGRHTTTTATLLPFAFGGYIVDTPGIRQFQLWDVIPEEVAGFFRDIRPLVVDCRFPNCTHTHEDDCAVKHSAADGRLDMRRYESYCHMIAE